MEKTLFCNLKIQQYLIMAFQIILLNREQVDRNSYKQVLNTWRNKRLKKKEKKRNFDKISPTQYYIKSSVIFESD